ncbi:unnamed protein product [marine sediment metagenome]|uniref:Uncharacterized protein n=1 Tax=marine sediment metagenome TaxID=412755 RepID=X1RK85_9ZZZZ
MTTGVDLRLVVLTGVEPAVVTGIDFMVTGVDIAVVTGIDILCGDLEATGAGFDIISVATTTKALCNASAIEQFSLWLIVLMKA